MITLAYQLRQLATRLPDADAALLWRAANQIDALRAGMELQTEPVEVPATLAQARDYGERRCLLAVLFNVQGNRSWAADRLRISRVALHKALQKHGLKPPAKKSARRKRYG